MEVLPPWLNLSNVVVFIDRSVSVPVSHHAYAALFSSIISGDLFWSVRQPWMYFNVENQSTL